jgi:uncharacterized membrane protein
LTIGAITGEIPGVIPVLPIGTIGDDATTGVIRGVVTGTTAGDAFGVTICGLIVGVIGKDIGDELLLAASTGDSVCVDTGVKIGELVGGCKD